MSLDLPTATSYSPLFLKLLASRGLESPEQIEAFLASELSELGDASQMKGVPEACERIKRACKQQEKVLIHGDYDIDGVTGAAILAQTLESLGASYEVFLPDRNEDGYGVSLRAIQEGAKKGVTLLMTVDCGITAHEPMQAAKDLGLETLVIDHHRIPEQGLPPATIIIDPLQEDCPYPFKDLSAGGLAFKLSYALLGEKAYAFLDLAALSTVGDVAPLRGENRILVRKGLERLSARTNPGIKALAEAGSIRSRQMNTGHVGFILGPRINAAGRMSSPDIALRLLLTKSEREAKSLATVLDEENKMRQKEERQVVKEAVAEVERTVNFNRDRVLVVAKRGWHAGVIGIVASRLVEKYNRPAVVIAIEEEKGEGKGSGRSIKGFHLFHALQSCGELFEGFGGHAQAAGLTITEENIAAFRKKVNDYAREEYEGELFIKNVKVDLELSLEDLRMPFLSELEFLEPHGMGNARPVFRTLGLQIKTDPKKISPQTTLFWVTDGMWTFEASWNDRSGNGLPEAIKKGSRIDLSYSIKIKTWNGEKSLLLEGKDIKESL